MLSITKRSDGKYLYRVKDWFRKYDTPIERYQTKDSLNAVSVGELQLKLSEVEKYRSDDVKLIETLNVDKKRLQSINTTQTRTIYELNADVRDSIVYRLNYLMNVK